jgi:hypothetical protein
MADGKLDIENGDKGGHHLCDLPHDHRQVRLEHAQ